MAEDEPMDYGLRQGMHHLPTEQNPNPQEKDPTLQNNDNAKYETLFSDCIGLDHGPTPSKRERCNTNHSRPEMLQSSNIHSPHDNHHWTRHSTTILTKRLPIVWSPIKSHLQQGPQVHLVIRKGPHNKVGNQSQHLHGISPSNGWPLRKEKPMDRTIPPNSHIGKPRRLDAMASPGLSSAQQ